MEADTKDPGDAVAGLFFCDSLSALFSDGCNKSFCFKIIANKPNVFKIIAILVWGVGVT